MSRVLSVKEQSVVDRFSKFKLGAVDVNPISFTSKGTMFNIRDPLVMKIGDTGALLVFGDLQKSMGLDELKAWLEERMRMEKEGKKDENEAEIEGEEHSCGQSCRHLQEDPSRDVAMEIEGSGSAPGGEDGRVSEDDVKLIMDQVSVPREKVMETLKECNYDVVNALIQLTKNE